MRGVSYSKAPVSTVHREKDFRPGHEKRCLYVREFEKYISAAHSHCQIGIFVFLQLRVLSILVLYLKVAR